MKQVAVLFARHDSIYYTFPECDVYDKNRDALTFPGGMPVIAHPPCRLWGRLRGLSTADPSEKQLALWAVRQVQQYGGVLEHPAFSTLWDAAKLPTSNQVDQHGGYTISIDQHWFGHRARKPTWLYVVGIPRPHLPPHPLKMDAVTHVVGGSKKRNGPLIEISKAEREHTPHLLAEWLISVTKKSNVLTHEMDRRQTPLPC